LADFANHVLNPLWNESNAGTSIDHDHDQHFSIFYLDTHSWSFEHVLQRPVTKICFPPINTSDCVKEHVKFTDCRSQAVFNKNSLFLDRRLPMLFLSVWSCYLLCKVCRWSVNVNLLKTVFQWYTYIFTPFKNFVNANWIKNSRNIHSLYACQISYTETWRTNPILCSVLLLQVSIVLSVK